MRIIVGLGNIGQAYARTKHNVGFMVIEQLAKKRSVRIREAVVAKESRKQVGLFGDYENSGKEIRLVAPLTMMNESGRLFRELETGLEDILVVCDDVNLPLGTLRIRSFGGSGGHHGLESCILSVESEKFSRLRVGVGKERLPRDLSDYVLSTFDKKEEALAELVIEQAAEACEVWAIEGIHVAMNNYNKMIEK